ncbi:MAG: Hsp20/alpha crystallin family protein [Planctomycetota bacterium]|jgi:HSP20 family protein
MNIIPWKNKGKLGSQATDEVADPFRPDFDRMVERFFDEPWGLFSGNAASPGTAPASFLPSLDVSETDDDVLVRAELPGLDPKEIDIQISDDVLTITGEKKSHQERRSENLFHSERRFGQFRRSVRLPSRVDADKVSAAYEAGILTVSLPRSAEARPRRIEVRSDH